MHRVPKGAAYFSECLINGFSVFSLEWLSGCQQEEDSFVPAVHPLHKGLGHTWLNANRRDIRVTANLSGLTWEDTTAYQGEDLHLT
jgi:hypothetical protein